MNAQFSRHRGAQEQRTETIDWIPAVDIVEHQDRFELLADLPGVAPDDIDIDLQDNVLCLAGMRARETRDHQRNRGERAAGRFCRRFALPGTVDGERIEAHSENGALRIRIPKLPEVQPRRIDVAAA